jgi:transposase
VAAATRRVRRRTREHRMTRPPYPTDLTDAQWALLAPLLPPARSGGRPRDSDLREIVNAALYRHAGSCSWRLLPHEFPPWQTVYTYVRHWQRDGTWERLLAVSDAPVPGRRVHLPEHSDGSGADRRAR